MLVDIVITIGILGVGAIALLICLLVPIEESDY